MKRHRIRDGRQTSALHQFLADIVISVLFRPVTGEWQI